MLDKVAIAKKYFGIDSPDEYLEVSRKVRDSLWKLKLPVRDYIQMEWPYYAPDKSLPPIPTPEEIENARSTGVFTNPKYPGDITRVKSVYAVKFSQDPKLAQEAENLLFLQDHEVRSPKLYAAFSHKGADPLNLTVTHPNQRRPPPHREDLPEYHYIVMEYIDGISIDEDKWLDIEPQARSKIYRNIGKQLQLLRSIPAPNPIYYGRIHHQRSEGFNLILSWSKAEKFIPCFDTYEALREHLLGIFETSVLEREYGGLRRKPEITPQMQLSASLFNEALDPKSKGAEPRLSHLDLALQNIRFRPTGSDPSERLEDYEVVIIDWALLHWMPAWMEIYKMSVPSEKDRDQIHWDLSQEVKPWYYPEVDFYGHCQAALFW